MTGRLFSRGGDGARFASEMYYYRNTAIGGDGQRFPSMKKLMLVK